MHASAVGSGSSAEFLTMCNSPVMGSHGSKHQMQQCCHAYMNSSFNVTRIEDLVDIAATAVLARHHFGCRTGLIEASLASTTAPNAVSKL